MGQQRTTSRHTSRLTLTDRKSSSQDAGQRLLDLKGALGAHFTSEIGLEGPLRIASLTPGELSIGTELPVESKELDQIAEAHGFGVTYAKLGDPLVAPA